MRTPQNVDFWVEKDVDAHEAKRAEARCKSELGSGVARHSRILASMAEKRVVGGERDEKSAHGPSRRVQRPLFSRLTPHTCEGPGESK